MKARMILAAGSLGTLLSPSAFAEDGNLAGDSATSKMSIQAQVEMLPLGSAKSTVDGMSSDSPSPDPVVAYGISAMFDYAVNPYLSFGVAPRLVLNVAPSDAEPGTKSEQEIDLRARIVGHYPVIPALQVYASLSPGYTILTSSTAGVDSAKGFAVAGAVGLTYDVSPKLFVSGEAGYQRAFISTDLMITPETTLKGDLELSYMHVGVGAGTRF